MRFFAPALVAVVVAAAGSARADEGMWLLNELPLPAIQQSTGKTLDAAWVQRVQKGALRLAGGCSASFVGKDGLVMTNHHCVRGCLEDLSVAGKDFLNLPFVAKTSTDELRCSKLEINQLQQIDDVTSTVLAAVSGRSGQAFADALKAEKARIESACAKDDATIRCEVITLFDGARFHLYKQRRFQDVRLVLAPEFPEPSTSMNVSTTNDIIGGNSGSPLLNGDGDVVGLVFDGNLASLGGRYVYEAAGNRTVAVHAEAILAALKTVYADKGSARVLAELVGGEVRVSDTP